MKAATSVLWLWLFLLGGAVLTFSRALALITHPALGAALDVLFGVLVTSALGLALWDVHRGRRRG